MDHASTRSLILRNIHQQRGRQYFNSVSGGKVYFENVSDCLEGLSAIELNGPQSFWAHFTNPEDGNPSVHSTNGARLWIFGMKWETGDMTVFQADSGGQIEAMPVDMHWSNGGPYAPSTLPAVINNDGNVGIAGYTEGDGSNCNDTGCKYFDTYVEETRNGTTNELLLSSLPKRIVSTNAFLPAYVGYSTPVNVSSSFFVLPFPGLYDPATHSYRGFVLLTNIDTQNFAGPFQLLISGLSSGASISNASGQSYGLPYISVSYPQTFAPGQSAVVPVRIAAPGQLPLFQVSVYQGQF